MTERQGVEIDYCPKCRGVWLDRGELDKILERSAQELAQAAAPQPAPQPQAYAQPPPPAPGYDPRYGDRRYSDDKRYHDERKYHEKRRKKSFFEEIFD